MQSKASGFGLSELGSDQSCISGFCYWGSLKGGQMASGGRSLMRSRSARAGAAPA